MVPFAGWEMPVQYAGVIAEHLAVRERAGVFDVSHMGEFRLRGPGALAFLQSVTTNDASKLKPGRAQYSLLPNEGGGVVDDIYVYRLGEEEFMVVVNASNVEKDLAHLRGHLPSEGVELRDESSNFALLAVQGPQAATLLQEHTKTDLSAKRKNSVFESDLFGRPVMMARTGYTGEDGFEVFTSVADAPLTWEDLLRVGVTPAGLGARDTLRLEAGYPLYGHELSDDRSPLETPFTWVVKTEKDFVGKEAMLSRPVRDRLVGLRVTGRGIPRDGYRVLRDGQPAGVVTSGTMSPSLKEGIALAYLPLDAADPGTTVQLEIRGNPVDAVVSEPSFLPKDPS